MKDFNNWFKNGSEPIVESPSFKNIDEDLWDYNDGDLSLKDSWYYPCRSCGENTAIECEPEEWDYMMHYCGGSPHCCP